MPLLAGQLLNAAFYAVVAGIGLTYFQGIVDRPGLATGLYMNASRLGSIFSGATVSYTHLDVYKRQGHERARYTTVP